MSFVHPSFRLTRSILLFHIIQLFKMFCKGLFTTLALAASAMAITYKGHDLSSVTQMEDAEGATFKNTAGTTESVEAILGAGGMNAVRLR